MKSIMETRDALITLLMVMMADDAARSLTVLSEELRQEDPRLFDAFREGYAAQYALKGCGLQRGHINALAELLAQLEAADMVVRINIDGEVRYRKK